VCDLETSRMGAPYIYDISRLRVNVVNPINKASYIYWLFVLKMIRNNDIGKLAYYYSRAAYFMGHVLH